MPSFGATINVGGLVSERNTRVLSFNAYEVARVVHEERQQEASRHALLRLATQQNRSRRSWYLVLTFTWPRLYLERSERHG